VLLSLADERLAALAALVSPDWVVVSLADERLALAALVGPDT